MTKSIFSPPPGAVSIDRRVAREARGAAKELDMVVKKTPSVCVEGCSHCCYQIVEAHSWEEEEISRFVVEEMTAETKAVVARQLQFWHDWFDGAARPSTRSNPITFQEYRNLCVKAAVERTPCPYLVDSRCAIYPARPAVCRAHIMKSDPEACLRDPLRESELDRPRLFENFASSGRFDASRRPFAFRPLPYLMIEGLKVDVESRPMLGFVWSDVASPRR